MPVWLIASEILLELKKKFPNDGQSEIPTVLAFGKIEGKGATNVIPEKVELAGTFRTMDESWRSTVHQMLHDIAGELSAQYSLDVNLRIEKGYPFFFFFEAFTQRCMQAAALLLGNDKVKELPLRMTAEDFAFISQKVPSCFFRLGTGNKAKGITSGVHTATFDIDENALLVGMEMLTWLAVSELHAS